MKVFIADDSSIVRVRLAAMLSEIKGVEIVGQAKNGREAILGIPKLKPDVVILDIRMPGGNGIKVLENIKKGKSPPIVFILTNYPYPQYRHRCMEAGADFFFDKTSEFEKVIDVCQRLKSKLAKNVPDYF